MNNINLAKQTVDKLKSIGVVFKKGLSESQLLEIEENAKGRIPSDLRNLLSVGVPIDAVDRQYIRFPDWHKSLSEPIVTYNALVEELFVFDVEENNFWPDALGARPYDKHEREALVIELLRKQPRFIPIAGDQIGMLAGFDDGPVLSYHGPLDTIAWNSLGSYLEYEFQMDLELRPKRSGELGYLPFWTDILQESW